MVFILMSQMFPMALLLIPIYIYFVRMRLLDTHAAVILAHAAIALPFSAWLLKGYIDTVPREIEEAAAIDGSSRLGFLVRIVSPMIAPGLVTAGVVTFLSPGVSSCTRSPSPRRRARGRSAPAFTSTTSASCRCAGRTSWPPPWWSRCR